MKRSADSVDASAGVELLYQVNELLMNTDSNLQGGFVQA